MWLRLAFVHTEFGCRRMISRLHIFRRARFRICMRREKSLMLGKDTSSTKCADRKGAIGGAVRPSFFFFCPSQKMYSVPPTYTSLPAACLRICCGHRRVCWQRLRSIFTVASVAPPFPSGSRWVGPLRASGALLSHQINSLPFRLSVCTWPLSRRWSRLDSARSCGCWSG